MPHVAKVMSVMLDSACSNPWYPEKKDPEPGGVKEGVVLDTNEEAQPPTSGGHLGWNIYRFDLCCVSYEVIARKRNGIWQVKKYRVLGMDE